MAKKRAPSILDPYEAKIRAWKEREGLSFAAIAEKLHQEYGVEVKPNTIHYFLKRRQKVEEVADGELKELLSSTLASLRQGLDKRFDDLHADFAEPILALAQAVRDVEEVISSKDVLGLPEPKHIPGMFPSDPHHTNGLSSTAIDDTTHAPDRLLPGGGDEGAAPMMAFSEVQLDLERATRIDYWLQQNLGRIWRRALAITALFWSGALWLWSRYGDEIMAWLHPWLLYGKKVVAWLL